MFSGHKSSTSIVVAGIDLVSRVPKGLWDGHSTSEGVYTWGVFSGLSAFSGGVWTRGFLMAQTLVPRMVLPAVFGWKAKRKDRQKPKYLRKGGTLQARTIHAIFILQVDSPI